MIKHHAFSDVMVKMMVKKTIETLTLGLSLFDKFLFIVYCFSKKRIKLKV